MLTEKPPKGALVQFLQPATWAEAVEAMAALPGALPVAGGTDVMVELNFHRRRPDALIDLARIQGLGEVSRYDGWLRLGAAATYDRLADALREGFPALAQAARTVGSPQIRHRGAIGGNLGACEQGECGACSVSLDGVLVCSCLVAPGQAAGADVVTVEGLAAHGRLDPVQEAFAEAGAIQCGFCTPGPVMAAHDLLGRVSDPADDQIREALAGNLCRCTGYQKIISAVHVAARNTHGRHGSSHEEVEEHSHAIPE
jgi:aerobic carbon-monoxide dehydrogenase small subunit